MAFLIINNTARVPFAPPANLGQLLRQAGEALPMPCGGQGRCGKCAALVSGDAAAPDEAERAALGDEKLAAGWRLCCRCTLEGDAAVSLPRAGGLSVVERGVFYRRQTDGEAGLGLSADIGTTTVVVYLYDLATGALLADASAANPQRAFGADVISRMQHSMEGERAALAAAVRGCLSALARKAAGEAGRRAADIGRAVIAGNTAMLYFLAALPVENIAFAPFAQGEWFGRAWRAGELELPFAADAPVYLVRSIGAYVGGDITAAALSCLLAERAGSNLLIDIGTNGEMALSVDGAVTCCSTAAGPALEGAGISCGTAAAPGAVSKVRFENGAFAFETIGGAPATGFCGTGVIDMTAALLDAGIADRSGRLLASGHGFEALIDTSEKLPAFLLPGTALRFTSKDLRAVQMAKAAIAAGIDTLLHAAGLAPQQLDTLFLAGGFGSFIEPKQAARIGLIPAALAAKTTALGNASGTGAAMMLLSRAERERAERLAQDARCTDLATDPYFLSAYTDGMFFPD